MQVRRFSATLLLGMLLSPTGGSVTFRHLAPLTLQPVGAPLRSHLSGYSFHPLDVGAGLAVVRTNDEVEVLDTNRLQMVAAYPLRSRSVCAVGLDGTTPVALVGCASRTSHHYTIVRFGAPPRRIPVRKPLATIAYPVSIAFGDGQAFVSHAFGAVDAIDLRTGAVRSFRPLRTLSKGRGYVRAEWLGGHLLGLGGTVVDVRSRRRKTLAPHASSIVSDGRDLATVGPAGVAVFTRDLHLYRRFLQGTVVDEAMLDGGVLYARVALVWHVYDVRTGRSIARLVPDTVWNLQLLGAS